MKAIGINGSPRKDRNTAAMIRSALEGAAEAGAETELIHLWDLTYSGCASCFACKLLEGPSFGRCGRRDDLTPVLEKSLEADVLIIGSPIYFDDVTAATRGYTERLLFPNCLYEMTGKTVYPHRIPVGLVYTMNCPDPKYYASLTENTERKFSRFIGPAHTVYAVETWQFNDYSKYSSSMMDPVARAKRRAEVFPQECAAAKEMGRQLALSVR